MAHVGVHCKATRVKRAEPNARARDRQSHDTPQQQNDRPFAG